MAQLYFFGNATHSQMTGMAILSETHTLVIDGGTRGDAAQIVELLLANGRTSVDAWFLTHPHHDHVGAITEVLDNVPTLCVNKIYYRFPSLSALLEMGARTPNERTIWYRLYDITRKEPQRFVTVETGMQFSFGELTVHVLRVYDPSITVNPVNNSSAVYRI
ncbi:MAG: MBL fold metallo-hydrolase, partial [Clostridia bacterium]|nr:MBL fold metallo-hydrolase [Clostridia bacterium]